MSADFLTQTIPTPVAVSIVLVAAVSCAVFTKKAIDYVQRCSVHGLIVVFFVSLGVLAFGLVALRALTKVL